MKIRIKTEEEFIEEFGENWRERVISGFPKAMDNLLGKIIDKNFYEWNISHDMISKDITYNKLNPNCQNIFCYNNDKQYIGFCKICNGNGKLSFLNSCKNKKKFERYYDENE